MRDSVLWRKQSRIVMMLAKEKNMTPEQALDVYYSSKTAQLLANPETGLQLMSDQYVLVLRYKRYKHLECMMRLHTLQMFLFFLSGHPSDSTAPPTVR